MAKSKQSLKGSTKVDVNKLHILEWDSRSLPNNSYLFSIAIFKILSLPFVTKPSWVCMFRKHSLLLIS